MEKKCNFCGNVNIIVSKSDYIYKYDNKMMLVNNVPCEICEFCGEKYFQAKVLKKIEADFVEIVIKTNKKASNVISVPVEEFVA